jgi:two-component system NtrC family response regulator
MANDSRQQASILIIDDDLDACGTMVSLVTRLGHRSSQAHTLTDGVRMALNQSFDLVFLDVYLPDGNGLDVLPQLMAQGDPPEVIILTGKGDPDGAELAIQGGVWDYLLKPTSVRDITLTLDRALKYRKEKKGRTIAEVENLEGILGKSSSIRACMRQSLKAARSDVNVLITGETGTGKELFAATIHNNSGRAAHSFVVVDCTSLTESLVEATLFGHLKGSFTGAQQNRQGLIKTADGGTLFLDEVGEMPLAIQKVFLRVLQEKQFRPVGANKEETSNFRLIAATNKDLEKMVEEGRFRSDLLFRIKTMNIRLPALRQRGDDIIELAHHQMRRLCREFAMPAKRFADDFTAVLKEYPWPGNVRELLSILERAVVDAGKEDTLYAMHLPRSIRVAVAKKQVARLAIPVDEEETAAEKIADAPGIDQEIFEDIFERDLPPLKDFKSTAERIYLSEVIRQCAGDIPEIMKISGLSRSHFYSLLKKYNLSH